MTAAKICSIDTCDGPTGVPGTARGWCRAHYTRWYRYGDPTAQPQAPIAMSNSERRKTAGARTAAAAKDALDSARNPERRVLELRAAHPTKSLAELAALAGMTKHAFAGRLRRAIEPQPPVDPDDAMPDDLWHAEHRRQIVAERLAEIDAPQQERAAV